MKYAIGLDYGTNSVRALVVDVSNGAEIGTSVFQYPSGQAGILLDSRDPELARQNPEDYLDGLEASIRGALAEAARTPGFSPADVIGIGVDTTGSTPIPVDRDGRPLAFDDRFRGNLDANVWLWKDHTGHEEAAEITARAKEMRPRFLAKCGGTYSSEWFWSKILHCARVAPEVFDAAYTWVEHADWMPAVLTGSDRPEQIRRGICAAGHKAMFHEDWGGYPDEEFLGSLDERLVRVRRTLPDRAYTSGESAGGLTPVWAERLGLPEDIPVAVGAFDAHLGAVGSGIRPGTLVKIIGTSTCDLMVTPRERDLPDIPGLCGIVPGSVLPGQYGMEAGQSAVGDIFNWFVNVIRPMGLDHEALTQQAEALKPGESGLLMLDWHNGNRTVLVDQRLTGLILGLTLHSTPAEIYRACVEATAFGARVIMERYESYGVSVDRIVNCGGISAKNRLVMQIYADVMGRPQHISRSTQTPALGAAIAGAVVGGGHADFASATEAMTGLQQTVFTPIPENQRVYDRLFALYRRLHDAFGVREHQDTLFDVMKKLLDLRDEVRA
ncbi:MAG TPA: ribulokinase [Rhodothermales bacterium]